MKQNQTRRKFIAGAMSGVLTAAVAPMAFAENQHHSKDEKPSIKQKQVLKGRVETSDFIIFPWGWMPETPTNGQWGDFNSMDDIMKDLYDCGFNTSGFTGSENLKFIRKNNLHGILITNINTAENLSQEKANDRVQKLMSSISEEDKKAIYAIYLRDEPSAELFPALNTWSQAVKKAGLMPYINLLPDYAWPGDVMETKYQEHLDNYVKTCNPSYISYDNYSLFDTGKLDEDRFYGNIESIRKKSLKTNIPFWNVILGNSHFHYIEPFGASLAVQVYSTLAYGGKGIGYFTYYTPQVGNYRLAPIDRFGYRTSTWELMRNINLQIHSLAQVYCKLKSINVFHVGKIPRNAQGSETSKLVQSITGDSLLVGEFEHPDGKPYVMVVNKSLHNSVNFDIQFKDKADVILVSQFDQGSVPFTGEQKWLAPGCGALLTVK